MTQEFLILELKESLERSLGFELCSLERLPGHTWSLNFKAVRAQDAFAFVVKLVPVSRSALFRSRYARILRHLRDLGGTKSVSQLFPTADISFREYSVCCITWCAGIRCFPDQLSSEQLKTFLRDYLVFSGGMQRTTDIFPRRDGVALKKKVLDGLTGPFGRILRRRLELDMKDFAIVHRKELIRVIHGDFHYGNFLFDGGELSGIFDLEEFRYGYPAEDFVRYVTCAVEHLRWYEQWRVRKLMRRFSEMVRSLPFSVHEWTVAVNVHFLSKASRSVSRGCGFVGTLNLLVRYQLYRSLVEIAAKAAGETDVSEV